MNEPVKCFFSAECVRKEKEGTFERFLFKGAPCHLKVLLLCTWRDEARYQGWVVKKKREWIREGGGRRCKFKTGVWGCAGEGGGMGEENINRACGAEAACHGPLQEKD